MEGEEGGDFVSAINDGGPAPALPEDVERAKVAAWEAAHDSLRDDVLHNADGFDNDIVNHFLGMIDDADQRPYAHVAPPVSASFDAALAALDYEPVDVRDTGQTVYELLGLDDVRAAHAEAVRVAVEAERARCMADCDAIYASVIGCADDDGNFRVGIQAGAQRCSAAIRARGVAKPRTDGEAATRSGEGVKS